MTTETPTPEDDTWADGAGEEVRLAPNGKVRLQIGEHRIPLDAPNTGQFRTLRIMAEDISLSVETQADEAAARAEAMRAELEAMAADEEMSDEERDRRSRALNREAVRAGRALTQAQEPLWLEWWAKALEMLAGPTPKKVKDAVAEMIGDHDLLPPYMAAQSTALRVMAHWRAGPLGRG